MYFLLKINYSLNTTAQYDLAYCETDILMSGKTNDDVIFGCVGQCDAMKMKHVPFTSQRI